MNASTRDFAIASSLALGLGLGLVACSNSGPTGGAGPDPAAQAAVPKAVQPGAAVAAPPAALTKVPLDGMPSIGSTDALVTIVEFTDYQCPYCERAERTIERVRATYGDLVRIVVGELPLPIHDRARPAAMAALAADRQGKFAAVHAGLFGLGGQLSDADIDRVARGAGLDMDRFAADRQDASLLAGSEALAHRLGVRGTPSFFVSGRFIAGAQPFETFADAIDERLAAARSLVAKGVRARDVYGALTASGGEHVAEDKEQGDADCGCGGTDDCDEAPAVPDKVETVPTDGAPSRGPTNAPIVVVAFEDFQCPFSARGNANLRAFESAHPGQVRVVFKNLPLPMHKNAPGAALAAAAADAQGHFWDMHDQIFAHQATLDPTDLEKLATAAGLDMGRFDRDVADPAEAARIDRDRADAEALGIKGTPTFFVNGRRVVGAQPVATFEAALAKGPRR